jgi:rabenosyn-5
VLCQLEKEIDGSLPELQEALLDLDRTPDHRRTVLSCRKRVLTRLASYDSLARRIRDLPSTPGEARLQRAIAVRAQLFLSDKMALLRGIGSFEELEDQPSSSASKKKSKNINPGGGAGAGAGAGGSNSHELGPNPAFEERAARLAVLLEQEKLVAGYVDDARAHRQLEDTATLQTSLDELYVLAPPS